MIDLSRFLVGEFEKVCGRAGTFIKKRKKVDSNEYGEVDVDDFCHFMAELEGGVVGNFSITRDAYGRGNYQRVEVYVSKGGIIYNMDKKGNNVDTIEVCIGDLYSQARDYHEIPVPQQFKADQMQAFFDIVNGRGDGLVSTSLGMGETIHKTNFDILISCIAKEN